MLTGAMTALVTPMRGGEVDYDRLGEQVQFQIDGGIDALVPVGTTGESPTLTHEEHDRVIAKVVEAAAGRVPVIAGTGSNATAEALQLTQHARQAGADACLQVNPYYNKPTQEGLYRHFSTIADAVDLPMVLYNIPGRTAVTMTPATVARLAQHPNIVSVKEATGSMDMATEIIALTDPATFSVLCGDDSLTLPLMSIGAVGVISVLSNLLPERIKALVTAAASGQWDEARKLHLKLFPLFKGMFVETNPIPIKAAMQMAEMDSGELRLPMSEIGDENRKELEKLLKEHVVI